MKNQFPTDQPLNKCLFFTEDPFSTVEVKGLAARPRGPFFSGRAHHLREVIDVSIVSTLICIHTCSESGSQLDGAEPSPSLRARALSQHTIENQSAQLTDRALKTAHVYRHFQESRKGKEESPRGNKLLSRDTIQLENSI